MFQRFTNSCARATVYRCGSLLCFDVQARVTTDVSGRRKSESGRCRLPRSVRIPAQTAQGRQSSRPTSKQKLGNVSYHVACHQRVQNIGPKTKQILELIEDTSVKNIERRSGHDGTYGVKSETLEFANKIVTPHCPADHAARTRLLRQRLPGGRQTHRKQPADRPGDGVHSLIDLLRLRIRPVIHTQKETTL